MQCLKGQTFSNSCAQNSHDLLTKIVGEVDGTKYWTLIIVLTLVHFELQGALVLGLFVVEIVVVAA